jgi:hypothetical protein
MSHGTKNCGVKCSFYSSVGHFENKCWKKPKDGKCHFGTINFLEVLLNDEEVTIQQLKLYNNENLFSYIRMPRRRMHVDVAPRGVVPTPETIRDGTSVSRDTSIRSKILFHFIKGKTSLSPMDSKGIGTP